MLITGSSNENTLFRNHLPMVLMKGATLLKSYKLQGHNQHLCFNKGKKSLNSCLNYQDAHNSVVRRAWGWCLTRNKHSNEMGWKNVGQKCVCRSWHREGSVKLIIVRWVILTKALRFLDTSNRNYGLAGGQVMAETLLRIIFLLSFLIAIGVWVWEKCEQIGWHWWYSFGIKPRTRSFTKPIQMRDLNQGLD